MKKTQIFSLLVIILMQLTYVSCVKDGFEPTVPPEVSEEEETPDNPAAALLELQIPEGFDFTTQRDVQILINDPTPNVRYDVYAYSSEGETSEEFTYTNEAGEEEVAYKIVTDQLNNPILSGVAFNGVLEQQVTLPGYFDKLYIRRNDDFRYSSAIIDATQETATFTYETGATGKGGIRQDFFNDNNVMIADFLYCVNGAGNLFQVDPLDGAFTLISQMPDDQGSFTAAIDQPNKVLYSIGRFNGNPLMKYDIENDTWENIANLGFGGPRLDYRADEGLLYFSNNDFIRSIDPTNGNTISSWNINGLDSTRGGDLAFANDGTLFVCTFSGLYRLDLNNQNEYDATRISGENLPFQPTSMTFDSNGELWLAHNGNNSNLIIMDTQTGGFEYRYGPDSDSNISYDRAINDLTTFRIVDETYVDTDTDGDGVVDRLDTFPDDAEKAAEVFTPSKFGWGTIAFEDLWPFLGDYDFNDVVVNYRVVAIANAQNEAVQLDFNLEVTANGGTFTNGFGIALDNLTPSQIESVSGQVITENYISLNANGTEQDQSTAVIITHDNNANMVGQPFVVSVALNEPIPLSALGSAPFNPFIIVNRNRAMEVHLINEQPTDLGEAVVSVDGVNQDPDGNYATDSGLPWGINIIHNFRPPRERVPINQAYNFFVNWAETGGIQFNDWYTDRDGYRNSDKIRNN